MLTHTARRLAYAGAYGKPKNMDVSRIAFGNSETYRAYCKAIARYPETKND